MSDLDELKALVESIRSDFPSDAYQAIVLGLLARSSDYDLLWSSSCLDGSDDKKTDILHVDYGSGRVIIAQGTESIQWSDNEPPANKASDLNAALAWLFDSDLADIGRDDIRSAAEDLRAALDAGTINAVEVYYIHNFPESANAANEMRTVEASLRSRLKRWEDQHDVAIGATARQFGRESAADAYAELNSAIRIAETVKIKGLQNFQHVSGPEWVAVAAPVSGQRLVELKSQFGEELFSSNIRDFLGVRRGRANINEQMRATVNDAPENFWIFNNGVTFVVRQLNPISDDEIECLGIGVTNGAQTIGALEQASVGGADLSKVQVHARFVQSSPALIESIIRFNNTQNPIKAWELRVLDQTQKRLIEEFQSQLGLTYVNRRGTTRVTHDQIHISRLAPWLSSFNGDPQTAHRNSPELFEDDARYNSLFGQHSDVRHLLLAYRIGEAVIGVKNHLKSLVKAETATDEQQTMYGYFRYGAFSYALISLVADVVVELKQEGAAARSRLYLSAEVESDREAAIEYLSTIVRWVLRPLPKALEEKDAFAVFRSDTQLRELSKHLQELAGGVQEASPEAIDPMVERIEVG